jgi:hypothetical protein
MINIKPVRRIALKSGIDGAASLAQRGFTSFHPSYMRYSCAARLVASPTSDRKGGIR